MFADGKGHLTVEIQQACSSLFYRKSHSVMLLCGSIPTSSNPNHQPKGEPSNTSNWRMVPLSFCCCCSSLPVQRSHGRRNLNQVTPHPKSRGRMEACILVSAQLTLSSLMLVIPYSGDDCTHSWGGLPISIKPIKKNPHSWAVPALGRPNQAVSSL